MGFRFRKSVKLGPFRITFSKSGISYSAGVKGLRVTKTASGDVRTSAYIPGTNISYVKQKKLLKQNGNTPENINENSNSNQHYNPVNSDKKQQLVPAQAARYTGDLPPFPGQYDNMIEEAARIAIAQRVISARMLQLELKLGFSRAARLIDQLEELGIVEPGGYGQTRNVIFDPESTGDKHYGS